MLNRIIILSLIFTLSHTTSFAQKEKDNEDKKVKGKVEKVTFDGEVVEVLITPDGDTVLLADFNEIAITDNRYATRKEQYHYYRVKRRALKVHGYAVKAITLFRELEELTTDMKKRKRKKHIKRLQKELKKQFDQPLRKLSRYEGYVLIAMIERELDMPLFEIVKELRGWWTANYWNGISKAYGFDIKEGYVPEKDPILENILADLMAASEIANSKK